MSAAVANAMSKTHNAVASKLPAPIRFPLIVALSLATSSLLYSLAAERIAGDLAAVSCSLSEWWEVAALVGWRSLELAIGWYGGFDGYDLASLMMLTHAPPLYLLTTFYEVHNSTALVSLAIDAAATYIPFRLLRPLSLAHTVSASNPAIAVPNRDIVTNLPIQTITTLLAASIYSVTLYTSFLTFLPAVLATYFDSIPTIAAVHSSTPISLLPSTLLLGLAAKSFIFTPATAISPSVGHLKGWNPATASLWGTVVHNFWGWNARTKCVIRRTALVMALVAGNTFVQSYMTVEGVEATGAAVYAGIWSAAAGITGIALGFVGDVDV